MKYSVILLLVVVFVITVTFIEGTHAQKTFPPNHPYIKYSGRTSLVNNNVVYDWPGVQFSLYFSGPSVSLIFSELYARTNPSMLNIILDGQVVKIITLVYNNASTFNISTSNTNHHLVVTKRTEPDVGIVSFGGVVLEGNNALLPNTDNLVRKIEFIGDSITCGFGNLGIPPCDFSPATEDNYQTYEVRIAKSFSADFYVEAWSGKGVVRNCCNVNGTSPDPFPIYYGRSVANYAKNDWNFKTWTPDAVVINLGTNDYSTQPQPAQDVFTKGYNNLISSILTSYAPAKPTLFLVCGPMIGNPCCTYVQQIANAHGAHFVDLQGILDSSDYGCDGHPSVSGHVKMASKATPVIEQVMGWK